MLVKNKDLEKKAHDILFESGWIRSFYYVLKVMRGNSVCTDLRIELNTYKWGRKVLFDKRDLLMEKIPDPYLKNEVFIAADDYMDTIRNTDYEIIEKIKSNTTNEKKENKDTD